MKSQFIAAPLSPCCEICVQVSGIDALSKAGFNFQLAYGSQSPVTELPPSKKGA